MIKTKKRGIGIVLALILILSIIIPIASSLNYGCCFHPDNFCQNIASAQECCNEDVCEPSIYDPNRPCAETRCEWQGCCLQTCTMTQYKDCNYDFRTLSELAPTYTCESAPECAQGCCMYLTAGSEVGSCEIKTQTQCQPEPFYPNTQFYEGMSEPECNNLCTQNQTITGKLSGFVYDTQSLGPIQGAQVVVAGISEFTDIQGAYYFEESSTGQMIVSVYAENYDSTTQTIEIIQNETSNLDVFLEETEEEQSVLTGYLKNEADQGIFGFIYYSTGSTFTNLDGKYSLSNVPPGSLEINAISNYYQSKTEYIDISPNTLNTHDFVLQSLNSETLCGNGVINYGEECEQGNDGNCQGQCNNCQCPDSCAEASGFCYTWNYQCEGKSGNEINILELDLCSAYEYQDSSYGCCDKESEPIPPCIDATINNKQISATDISDSSGTMCKCGAQYFDVANPAFGEGYCCAGEYHTNTETCNLAGTVSGFIFGSDLEQIEPINQADLVFTLVRTTDTFSTISYEDGFYITDLPEGDYSLLVTKYGYVPFSAAFSILSAEHIEQNTTLTELELICSPENITSATLSSNQFQGIKKIELVWAQECIEDVSHFEIYRNSQLIHTTFGNSAISYMDNSLSWDTDYTYTIKTHSTSGNIATSEPLSLNSGTSICENKFEDESWCLDGTKRVVCNENNQPILWDGYLRGSENGDCSVAVGNGSICQQEDQKTWCAQSEDCSQTGLQNNNLFGLFYNLVYPDKSCHYTNIQSSDPQRRYCYYDAYQQTWTSVDKCLSCSPETSCFNYKTESACAQDNCLAPSKSGQGCEWQTSYQNFQLLGKGYCVPADYGGTDQCSLCSPDADPFSNTECTSEICSSLGNCYSAENESACLTCTDDTTCESYLTKTDCEGQENMAFEINGNCESDFNLTWGQDNCNLGRCEWKNNECIKDGDDDGKDDCNGNIECLKDNLAPFTTITNLPGYINFEGTTLTFEALDISEVTNTYYCIKGNCCPLNEPKNNTIFINGETPELRDKEGEVNINYYSIDENKNIEEIKSTPIYVDTKNPEVSLFYYLENSSNSTTISDLYINITLSEPAICTDTLTPGENTLLHLALINKDHLLNYNNLEDGRYQLTLECTDLYQNKIEQKWDISVDRYQKIVEETPHLQTLPESDITLSAVTLRDQLYCYYKKSNEVIKFPFNIGQSGKGIPQGNDYIYTAPIGYLESESYEYDIECYNSMGGDLKDSCQIAFTIDGLAPETELRMLDAGNYHGLEDKPYAVLNFNLLCEDTEQPNPGAIGCSQTFFCIDENNIDCYPNSTFLDPETFASTSGDYKVCYHSNDQLDNMEQIKCDSILIDSSSPKIQISNLEMSITTDSSIGIEGTWEDTSAVEIFVKTRNAENVISDSYLANIKSLGDHGTFSANIPLFSGYNQITATVYDIASNQYSDSTIIYYDDKGPSIKTISIIDSYSENDPDSDYIFEYGAQILFEAEINDYLYSDIYEERTTDVLSASIKIDCLSGCSTEAIESSMSQDSETNIYSFSYSPELYGILTDGNYMVSIIMEDEFGNIATEQYQIKIGETIGYELRIQNHNNIRIDTLNAKGESGYPIHFSFITPKSTTLEKTKLMVTHENPIAYEKEFNLGTQQGTFTKTITDYMPAGHYMAAYILEDTAGKSYQNTHEFEIEDTLPAAFNITILKDEKATNSIGYGIFDVLIHAYEPVSEIEYLKYQFNGKTDTVKDISGSNSNWQGKLYAPTSQEYSNIENALASFSIQSTDLNEKIGGNIIYGKEFTINTKGPDAPIILEPLQITHYTNTPSKYFMGHTSGFDSEVELTFKRNRVSTDPIDPGWENLGQLNVRPTNTLISTWESSIYGPIELIAQNQIRLNDPSSFFQPERYFDFTTIKTQDRSYRKIEEVSLYSDPDGIDKYYTVTFSPEIQTPIENYQGQQTSEDIKVYNAQYPSGWFDGTINLEPGINYVALQPSNTEGIYGEFSTIYPIIYDPTNPTISGLEPMPDSYTNEEKPIIKATISDTHSPIDIESTTLTIEKENYTISCGETYCANSENQQACTTLNCNYKSETELELTYQTPIAYIPGWKEAKINTRDLANNQIIEKWGFWVDGLTPYVPEININPGNRVEDSSPYTLYSNNQKPNLEINFLPFETIELLDYYLLKGDIQIQNALTINKISDYKFTGQIKQALMEDQYKIYIQAKKKYPNGSWSNAASWQFPLVIDQTNPILNAAMPDKTNGGNSIINISYIEENPYYIEFGDEAVGTIDYKKLFSPMQHLVQLTEEQGEKTITALLSDKAGNTATKTLTTFLDNIGPKVSDNYQNDGGWVRAPQHVTISASDLHGIKEIRYCTVSTCDPLTVGTILEEPYQLSFEEEQATTVSYLAIDTFNNPSEIASFKILFDATPPQINATTNPNVNRPEIIIYGKAIDSNIERIEFSGNLEESITHYPELSNQLFTQPLTLTSGTGQKTATITAYDLAGNTATKTLNINLDPNAIPLSISHIDDATQVDDYFISSQSSIKVHGYYLFSESVRIYPKINPSNLADTQDGSFELTLSSLDGYTSIQDDEKTNIITLVAEEPNAEKFELNLKVIQDTKGPEITLEEPKTYSTQNQKPTIKISTDESAECNVEYLSYNIEMETADNKKHQIKISQNLNLETNIKIVCTDLSNQETALEFLLRVDNTKPIIYFVNLYGAELLSQQATVFNFLLFRSHTTGIGAFANEQVRCKYGPELNYNTMIKFDGFDDNEFAVQQLSQTFDLDNGHHTLYILCEDHAGNLAQPAELEITTNTDLPIQIIDPKPNAYTNQRTPEITFETYRNATCTIDAADGTNARILDAENYEYKESGAKTFAIEQNNKFLHSAQVSGPSSQSMQLTELQDGTPYGFEISCKAEDNGIEDSEKTYIYFTTDFTAPTISIASPENGITAQNTFLEIEAVTESNANYTISVNGIQQSYETITLTGKINDFAILGEGNNNIKIEAKDKAGNTANSNLFIKFQNQGPTIEQTTPLNKEVLPPITQIKAKIKDTKTSADAELLLYMFDATQNKIMNPASTAISGDQVIFNIVNPTSPLPQNKYRAVIIPTDEEGGEGKNILFEIGNQIPEIWLSSPYTTTPYKGKIISSKEEIIFSGLISSDSLLKAQLYLNSKLVSEFNDLSFSITPDLKQGMNNFVIKAITLNNDVAIRYGEITLDSEGPTSNIIIE